MDELDALWKENAELRARTGDLIEYCTKAVPRWSPPVAPCCPSARLAASRIVLGCPVGGPNAVPDLAVNTAVSGYIFEKDFGATLGI